MKNRIPPPVWTLMFAVAMWFVAHSDYAYPFEVPNRWITVGLFVAVAAGYSILAIRQFNQAKTTVNPLNPEKASALVTDGIFAKSRNPMYVGMLMLLAAWTIWLQSLTNIAVALLFVPVMNFFQIKPEEKALRELFGTEYEDYCRQVRRWW